MSEALNIYPFQDTETTIRFGVQLLLFFTGLFLTNNMLIKPVLKLQAERKKRTLGNQIIAQNQNKQADSLELTYNANLTKAIENARSMRDAHIQKAKETAHELLTNATQKATERLFEIKNRLKVEKREAYDEIHMHMNAIVKDMYAKFGIHE